ncbi:hypothetical protein ABTH88_22195, partial [Acinetobacter baumannii]
LRRDIVTFLSKRCRPGDAIPARSVGLLDEVRRHVIRGQDDNRWAEQIAPTPWEIRQRPLIVAATVIAALVVVCATGIAVG